MKKSAALIGMAVLSGMLAQNPAYARHHSHAVAISAEDRETIRDYLRGHYKPKHCPPGLAKKHNGCLPPGIAKKYAMGERLPGNAHFSALPSDLLDSLQAVPGYRYGRVDDDVVLVSDATQKVMDAVTLLSALK